MRTRHSIGSREELYKMSGNEKAKTVEFHRPYIDEITITCPECGKQMKRVPEVIDSLVRFRSNAFRTASLPV